MICGVFVDRVFVNRGSHSERREGDNLNCRCLDGVLWRNLNESKRYTNFSRTESKYCHTLIEIFLNPTEISFLITIASLNYYGYFHVPCVGTSKIQYIMKNCYFGSLMSYV